MGRAKANSSTDKLVKIVYFDEDSVTDYIQIVEGGTLEKTTELLNATSREGNVGAGSKASIGIGGMFKALVGMEVSTSVDSSMEASFNTSRMAKNIVKNTILTDFIAMLEKDRSSDVIRKFRGYTIIAPKDSLSYVALITPYLSMLKGGTAIPAGDFSIAVEKLDNTIKSAKGYYEFVGISKNADDSNVIFRFNIKSFKNNYKVADLLKMDVCIYAVKVGTNSIDKLDFNRELNIDTTSSVKDNPKYQKVKSVEKSIDLDIYEELQVYDVLLAGVEAND